MPGEAELPARRHSARIYLLGLIAAAVVPVWLFAAYVLVSFALSQQRTYRGQSVELARQAASAVDDELRDMLARIDTVARSAAFVEGDLAKVHAEARGLIRGTGETILLRERGSNQLMNTQVEFGEALPPATPLTDDELADYDAGVPRVSNVHAGSISGEPRIAVARPLTLNDGTQALIVNSAPTSSLHPILKSVTPEGWIVGVGDRNGVYVTRSERHEEVSGKPGVAEYLNKAIGRSGSFTAENQFGDELLAGYVRSDFSGWLYAANVGLAVVEAPLWRSLFSILAIGATALAVSLVLAYLVAKRLAGETAGLARQALALGSGQPVEAVPTHLQEFGLVSDALVDADLMLRERTSELQTVLDTVPVAVWFTYDPSGRQVIRNRFAAELMDVPSDHANPYGAPDPVIDTIAYKDGEVVSREDRPLTKAMRGELTDHEDFLYKLPSGNELILSSSARPIFDAHGKIVGAVQISLDITERRRAENQRRLLTKELNHRVKNNLAIVQALVQQTLRNAGDLDEAAQVVSERLAALSSAHDVLAKNAWMEGDLRTTIEAVVHAQAHPNRISIAGPEVSLAPGQVMAISLAVHELATNAVKYGALSNEDGRVSISWEVAAEAAGTNGSELVVTWSELGGPPVTEPDRRGFGSRLLERITAGEGGSAERAFPPTGLVCTLRLPRRDEAND